MAPTRRRFLQMLGLAPVALALPPVHIEDILVPELVPMQETGITGGAFTAFDSRTLVASGGFCAPMAPLYDFSSLSRPVDRTLPPTRPGRGTIRYFRP